MGAHGIGPVASAIPVGGTFALVMVLVVAILALHVARKVAAAREPMFPELTEPALDPAAFARELAEGGTVADDAARFTDVAHHSGVQQAYALLALVNTDGPATPAVAAPTVAAPARSYQADPFADLAELPAPPPLPGTSIAPPAANDDDPADDCMRAGSEARPTHDAANARPDDTLLPGRRSSHRRGRAA